jgi:hypothetical protein
VVIQKIKQLYSTLKLLWSGPKAYAYGLQISKSIFVALYKNTEDSSIDGFQA